MAYIYKITNLINNKVYIGETVRPVETRWKEHKSRAKSKKGSHGYDYHLYSSMRKYGIENFIIEELEFCLDEERYERETYYIELFESFDREKGYNSTIGGKGALLYKTEDFLKLWERGLLICEIAQEMKCSKGVARERLYGAGVSRTDIVKRVGMNVAKRCAYPVLQFDYEGNFIQEWESAAECGRNGFEQSAVSNVCLQKQKSAYGYLWKYKSDERDIQEWVFIFQTKRDAGRPKKKIQQISLTGDIINTFSSASEAAKALGKTDKSNICAAARKNKKAYGYYWRYINE